MTTQTLSEKKEAIQLLMKYAVPADQMPEALKLLDHFQDDPIAANLLHAFYSYLPEGLDDNVRSIRTLARRQGSFLLGAITTRAAYLYLVTVDKAEFLGNTSTGIWEKEVLNFFELGDRETHLKQLEDLTKFPEHRPALQDEKTCPACAVGDGEKHVLGCPVEVCPWCGGQLTSCHCRFEKLDRDHILGERELKAFEEKLAAKGRIPYDSAQHRPAYPSAGEATGPASTN